MTMPKLGARVRYSAVVAGAVRRCTGVVVAHYPGGQEGYDEDTGERWIRPDHVGVKVDSEPEWWPYVGTDRFAPSVDEIEPA